MTLHIAVFPAASVAVYDTSVIPGGSSSTVDATVGASSHVSVAIAPGADTVSSSAARTKISGAGHSICGAAVSTIVTSVVHVCIIPSPDRVKSTVVVPSGNSAGASPSTVHCSHAASGVVTVAGVVGPSHSASTGAGHWSSNGASQLPTPDDAVASSGLAARAGLRLAVAVRRSRVVATAENQRREQGQAPHSGTSSRSARTTRSSPHCSATSEPGISTPMSAATNRMTPCSGNV